MISYWDMLRVFFDRTRVDHIASHRANLKDSIMNAAKAFFPLAFVLDVQIAVFVFLYSIFTHVGLLKSMVLAIMVVVGYFVLAPLLFILQIGFAYFWGSVTFYLADFMKHKAGKLEDFNSDVISLFACIKLVQCLMLLVPLVGWIAALFAHFYSISLYYRLVKVKLGLSDERAAILVLLPIDILMSLLLVVALVVSGAIIGSKVF